MTKEDLQLLRDMMKEEIGAALEPIKADLSALKAGQETLETDVRHTRMLIEKQEHHVQLIAEQYGDISAKLERVREIGGRDQTCKRLERETPAQDAREWAV